MKRQIALALVLLSVFGLRLIAGPHPCQAPPPEPGESTVEHGCHGSGHPEAPPHHEASSSPVPEDCCSNGEDPLCEHACHLTAVLAVQAVPPTAVPAAPLALAAFERPRPSFTQAIDHVPLA